MRRPIDPKYLIRALFIALLMASFFAGAPNAYADTTTNISQAATPPPPAASVGQNDTVDPVPLPDSAAGPSPPPPVLKDLQEQNSGVATATNPDNVGLQIRADALREASLSYGARGGLAYRTFEIQRRLAEYETSLSKAFDFSRLLIAAPSGLLIEPPVVSEGDRAVIVAAGGQTAAIADRVYRINRVARIVTSPRNWHLYLERDWGRVDPPPGLLLPRDDTERAAWRRCVKEGWNAGIQQAEETFEADLDRMTADFIGMVRYRELLAQGMISPPYALSDDRGVTGGGAEMRIGDRGVAITGQSALIPRSNQWNPAPR
jgi:defect-in-organelle-trafficking protein DotC